MDIGGIDPPPNLIELAPAQNTAGAFVFGASYLYEVATMAWPFDLTQEFWEWLRGNKPATNAPEVRAMLVSGGANGDTTLLPIDDDTGALETIGTFHAAIHKGRAWWLSCGSTFAAPLANNQALDLIFRTEAAPTQMHVAFNAISLGDAEFYFVEGTTLAGGVAIVPKNFNRTSPNVSGVVASYFNGGGAPPAHGGTELIYMPMSGGKAANSVGSEVQMRCDEEWPLAPATEYLLRVVNVSGLPRLSGIGLEWYIPPNIET